MGTARPSVGIIDAAGQHVPAGGAGRRRADGAGRRYESDGVGPTAHVQQRRVREPNHGSCVHSIRAQGALEEQDRTPRTEDDILVISRILLLAPHCLPHATAAPCGVGPPQ